MTVTQRSPYNDRYKVDQKGKTRRSASAAKPKRDVADLTPRPDGKPAARKSRWRRAAASVQPTQTFVMTPEMRKLRRVWWVLWTLSLVIALGILYAQRNPAFAVYVPFGWGLWLLTIGATFYLEFFPLRRLRLAAVDAAKQGKGGKSKAERKPPAAPTQPGPSSGGGGSGTEGDEG